MGLFRIAAALVPLRSFILGTPSSISRVEGWEVDFQRTSLEKARVSSGLTWSSRLRPDYRCGASF